MASHPSSGAIEYADSDGDTHCEGGSVPLLSSAAPTVGRRERPVLEAIVLSDVVTEFLLFRNRGTEHPRNIATSVCGGLSLGH